MNGCGIIIHVLKRERLLSVLNVCELEKQMTASHLGKQAYLRLSRCESVKIRQNVTIFIIFMLLRRLRVHAKTSSLRWF